MALWRLTVTALRSWDTLAGGRARLQAGTGLQSERNKSPSSGILRPVGEKLAFPQWWALKPFYLAIKAKETSEGFGHARSCRIRLFSVWPSRGSPCLQPRHPQVWCRRTQRLQSPVPSTTGDLSLGQFHLFLSSSYFNSLSALSRRQPLSRWKLATCRKMLG